MNLSLSINYLHVISLYLVLSRVTFGRWSNSQNTALQGYLAWIRIRKYQTFGECSLENTFWKWLFTRHCVVAPFFWKVVKSPTICMKIRQHICGYLIDSFFLQYNYILNLCHSRMTPLRTILQHIKDEPYTTPAKRDPKIGTRVYCRNVISDRALFRLDLNVPVQIAEWVIRA